MKPDANNTQAASIPVNPTAVPIQPGSTIPDIRSPDTGGLENGLTDTPAAAEGVSPAVPKTSGAPMAPVDPSKSPVANRDTVGPRKAGMTPRPTADPISDDSHS